MVTMDGAEYGWYNNSLDTSVGLRSFLQSENNALYHAVKVTYKPCCWRIKFALD